MITPILTLNIPVRLTAGFLRAEIDVRLAPRHDGPFDASLFDPSVFDVGWDYAGQPQIAIELDGALTGTAWPRTPDASGARRQIIPPWRLEVGGVEIPWYRRFPGMSVRESIDGTTQFNFSMPRRGGVNDPYSEPLGSPVAQLGVPGGKKSINVTAELLTASGTRQSIPLVRDGMLDNTLAQFSESGDRRMRGSGGDVRTWTGGGAHARVDRTPVTYQAPPGHGQQSGTVVRRLLQLAGVPATKIAISGGRRLYKEISLIDSSAIAAANEILLPENRRVFHDDRTDTWRLHDFTGIEGRRVEAIITESDVLSVLGQLGDAAAADAPTCVVLTSTAQVTKEECGTRLDYKVIDHFSVEQIRGYYSIQSTDGTIQPNGSVTGWAGKPATLRHSERTVIVKEIDCETVISEETVVYRWFAPEASRYLLDTEGAIAFYRQGVYFYDQGVEKDDNVKAFLWPTERWTAVSWRRTENSFDERGYLTTVTELEGGWLLAEGPHKERTSSTTSAWSAVPFVTGPTGTSYTSDFRLIQTRLLNSEAWYGPTSLYDERLVFTGGGQTTELVRLTPPLVTQTGLSGGVPNGDYVAKAITERQVTDDGFIVAEDTTTLKIHSPQGAGNFLYSFGESIYGFPDLRVAGIESVRYGATGESSHDRISFKYDFRGNLVDQKTETNVDGYLPAADQRTDIVPPESAFDDPDEYAFALAASRNENRPIKAEVCAPALESILIPWTMKGVTPQYAENEDDLVAVGMQIIRESSSIEVSVPVPFNPLIRPAHYLVVHLPSIAMFYDILVESVDHSQDDNATLTQITGRHDVV